MSSLITLSPDGPLAEILPEGFALSMRAVYDNSMLEYLQRCPRKFFYRYVLNRAPVGVNIPINYGSAYHKFREVLEIEYMRLGLVGAVPTEHVKPIFGVAASEAFKGWVDPPIGHKKEYLDGGRLMSALTTAFDSWLSEKSSGLFKVLAPEQGFDLPLTDAFRFGGRIDQVIEWNRKMWVRDFKTTGRMGASYGGQWDPNHQFTGYAWATEQLSGRSCEGVLLEVVYNTKTKGPEFHYFPSARSPGHVETWKASVVSTLEVLEKMMVDLSTRGLLAFPMHTVACNDYGGCFYREACRKEFGAQSLSWLEDNTVESIWDFMNPDDEAEGVLD